MPRIVNLIGSVLFALKKRDIKDIDKFSPKNILIIRSGALGDVLMTTPLVKALRQKFPEANINYLTGDHSKQILDSNPHINEIISFDEQIIFKYNILRIFSLIREIRKKKYDLAFVMDKSWVWGVIAFLCKIDYRIGFNRKGEGFANNMNIDFDGSKYELEYNNELASFLNIFIEDKQMQIFLSDQDKEFADEFVRKNKTKKYMIGIGPGGAKNPGQVMDAKRPSKPKYAKICNALGQKANIVLFGSKDDEEIASDVVKMIKSKPFDMSGRLSIKQSAALIQKCNLFITHDTGLMHIAAAVNSPIIALFGPTSPERFAPKDAKVIATEQKCKPCYDIYGKFNKKCKCIDAINPDEVVEQAERILETIQ